MPEARDAKPHASAPKPHAADRAVERDAELAGIDSLIDRLVPALTAKLASTHLGELEVRDGESRIRLRRPSGASWNGELRRAADRAARGAAGHDAHGHARTAGDGARATVPGGSNGTGPGSVPGGPAGGHASGAHGASAVHPRPALEDETRRVATSPAVGVFRPGSRATVGARVRAGDALGHVDVLGVAEEIPAPVDGMVAELLVEPGTAVEYGQELILVALAAPAEAGRA